MKTFNFNGKYFLVGLILILLINYGVFFGEDDTSVASNTKSGSSTISVELGDIKESIEVVGDAELVDEQSLSFNKAGTVTAVYFKEGASVQKGDIIAQLDDSDGYDSIEDAKISLQNAKIALNDLYEEADESKQLSAKNSITNAQNNLDIAQKEYDNSVESYKNSLNQKLENIEYLEKELEILKQEKDDSFNTTLSNKEKTIIQLEDSLSSELSTIDKILEQVDKLLGVTLENKEENDDFELYLGAKDKTTKSNAEASFKKSLNLYNELTTKINSYSERNIDELKSILADLLVLYKELENTTNLTYKAVDASLEGTYFSENDIESNKSTMSSNRSTAQSKITSVNSSITTLNTLTNTDLIAESNTNSIEKQELEITNAKKDYELTKKEYETSIESKKNNLENLEKNLELAKINYDELMEGPTASNITKAQNSIKQAQIKLDSAYEALDDYRIEAPFDGVVRKIDYMVGDKITNDTSKTIRLENPNLVEILVYLDQIDIVTVSKGDAATITFDAYPTNPVKAVISNIDTTPVQSSGVVSYEVKLVLDDDSFDKKILSGFTADAEILTKSLTDVLLVKTSALIEEDGKYYLNILKDGKIEKTEVEIGLDSSGKTQIVSGVSEGDTISTQEFVASSSEEEESSTSLFGPSSNRGTRQGPPGGF